MPGIESPPSIIVRQVFEEALGLRVIPTLPACIIGEHFQIENTPLVAGNYTGVADDYLYPDKAVGAVVDPATVKVFLETVEDEFDITGEAGVVIDATDVSLPAAITPEKELTSAKQVSPVAGTTFSDPTGLFITQSIRPGDILRFDTAGPLAFVDSVLSINAGDFIVLEVLDESTLVLDTALVAENKVEYQLFRGGSSAGTVKISYQAQRFDLVEQLRFLQGVTEIEQVLGSIVPENPLAFAAAIAAQNTDLAVAVTAINDIDDQIEHQRTSEFLEGKGVYGIVPLTQKTALHVLWQQHVNQQSDPEVGFYRVVLINPDVEDFKVFQESQVAIAPTAGHPTTTFDDPAALFVTNGVPIGAVLHITAATLGLEIDGVPRVLPFDVQIVAIVDETEVTTLGAFTADPGDITYDVRTKDFTKFQKAQNIRDLARTFADRRVWMVFPDQLRFLVGDTEQTLPGYYAAAAHAGLVSGVSPSQPLSRVALAGPSGVLGSNDFFTPSQLNTIQSGGVMILEQLVVDGPVTIRRQLTTDTSSLKKAEQTGTRVPDFVSFFLKESLDPIVGRHLLTNDFIENQARPGLNGLLRDLIEEKIVGTGTQILSLEKDPDQGDTLLAEVDLEVLDPANFFDITLKIR